MVLGEMEWTHHTNAYSKEVERRSRLEITSVSKVEYRISWSNFPVQTRFFPDSSLMSINIPYREFVSMYQYVCDNTVDCILLSITREIK
jgi:hypothetical protein